jgi:hypothetical protein
MQLRARSGNAAPYEVTAADVLWLQRAVQAEGEDPRQVAAVLVNGFMWNRSRGSSGTLASWVRSYAQPVNPRWYESGDKHQAALLEAGTNASIKDGLITKARNRERVHSVRTSFDARTLEAVRDALAGMPSNVKRAAVDYAAPRVASSRIPLEPVPTTNRNRLYTRLGAESWQGYVGQASRNGNVQLFLLLGLGAAAAGTTYYVLRKRKGRLTA